MSHGGEVNDLLLKRVLYGISCRNYEAAAEAIPGAIGLSSSTVSRGFVQASAAKLREMQERDLTGEDVVALFLDGKTFAEATMVVALGITLCGEKRFLGFVETDTENAQVLTPFLRSLLERGLDISQGLLVIIDGGKGLQAAVKKAFRKRALIQRCQWHKRENVVSYLSKGEQASWRKRLQWAYNRPEYEEALTALEQLHGELEERNQSAAGSLEEGLEETLTLHRLGVHAVLGRNGLRTRSFSVSVSTKPRKRLSPDNVMPRATTIVASANVLPSRTIATTSSPERSRSCISRSFAALASTKPRDTDELDRPIAPGTNSAADS